MSRSSKRSRASKHKQSTFGPQLPLSDHQVLTVRQWSQLANISVRTAKRLFQNNLGPKRVQLSSNRCGVTIAAHKEWLASRERVS